MTRTTPVVKVSSSALAQRTPIDLENMSGTAVRAWANGEATLQELKGYTEEELYFIAQHAYTLFLNGKIKDAQAIFEGLVAVNPRNDYYYRAVGVLHHSQGDIERALRQFTHATTVAPESPSGYVNRAEVHIARRDFEPALLDLDRAIRVGGSDATSAIVRKAIALRSLLRRRRQPW
mgnify:CR=1 FL=1